MSVSLAAVSAAPGTSVLGGGANTAVSLLTVTGVGVGGVFVATGLILLLAYLNVLDASEWEVQQLRTLTVATAVPLFLTFTAIVCYEALLIL